MGNSRIYFVFSFFFFVTIAEGGSIFKWVDEQGVMHYSAAPPLTDKKVQQLKIQPAPPVVESESQQLSTREWEANENAKNYKQRRNQQEEAENRLKAEKIRRCAIAKQKLQTLQKQGRIYKFNEKGEKEYWDDNFHDAEIIRMNEEVEKNCGQKASE